ncbi:AsmA family protein [Maridesulfovibrio frigidus]|uniref:AsmA family protein n=1 Tax=Maridesulfovibrio frigidus TaxID=340956 RepID=UPI0004E10464|nr:AsmA family protein [Maridesulfovibrio frigidus]
MSKSVKIIGIVTAVLVVLIASAMVLATILIDPNDYKDEISKAVLDKTGRQLTFYGNIELSVFPWLGVTTSGVSLSNAKGFAEKNMFSLKSADISVKLIPLLSSKVHIRRIDVDGLSLNLSKNKSGVTNWDDLVSKSNEPEKTADSSKKSDSEMDISVGGLVVENAKIVWDNRQNGVRQAIEDFDAMIDGFAPGEPFKFEVHVLAESSKPEISADTETSGTATLSADFKTFSVEGLSLSIDATGAAVPGGKGKVQVTGDAALNLVAKTADIGNLVFEAYGVKAEGSFKATGIGTDTLKFSGDMNVPGFDARSSLDQMAMDVKMSDSKALTSVGLNFAVAGTAKSVAISNLLINLDETTIKGAGSFANPDRPNIVLNLDVDKFNLDGYLPPESETKADTKGSDDKAVKKTEKTELFPVEFLRKLTLKTDLSVKQLIAGKADLTNVVLKVRAKDGVLSIKPLSLNAAKGAFTSTAGLNVRGKTPTMSFAGSLSGMDGETLSRQMTGKDNFSGKMGFNTKLASKGNDLKTVFANLKGNFGFKVLDGYVTGFDILFLAGDAFNILTGGTFDKTSTNKTEFGEASATAIITKGVAVNKDLILKSPLFRADGKGNLNLNTMMLDYGVDAKIVGSLEGQGGKSSNDLIGLTVPLNITGPVANPSIMVDLPRFAVILAESGFTLVNSVIGGVEDVIEGLGKTITGKGGSTSSGDQKADPVKKIGDSIKSFF